MRQLRAERNATDQQRGDHHMATFVNDCPHCGASSAAFNIPYASENPVRGMYWNALAICPACGNGIYVCARWQGTDFARQSGDVASNRDVDILNVSPRRVRTNAPEYVPVPAKRAFEEGAECLASGRATAAAAMFRRCLEIALKAHSPKSKRGSSRSGSTNLLPSARSPMT